MISSTEFYHTYHGHKVDYLKRILHSTKKPKIFLAGDSILDNKYWILDQMKESPTNGYQELLTESVPDVAHQLNKILEQRGLDYIAINAAVEEQTIASKQSGLTPQDRFIRDNITSDDILVVSLGGNDIALKPTMKTIFAMGQILFLNKIEDLENLDRKVVGFASLQELFVDGIREYIGKLTEKTMPGGIVVTTLYYMSETGKGWADTPLKLIGYSSNPLFIQALLRRLSVEMEKLLPEFQILPLWQCLDGKTESDYIERVEPSVTGGEKMARYIIGSLMKRSCSVSMNS